MKEGIKMTVTRDGQSPMDFDSESLTMDQVLASEPPMVFVTPLHLFSRKVMVAVSTCEVARTIMIIKNLDLSKSCHLID